MKQEDSVLIKMEKWNGMDGYQHKTNSVLINTDSANKWHQIITLLIKIVKQ